MNINRAGGVPGSQDLKWRGLAEGKWLEMLSADNPGWRKLVSFEADPTTGEMNLDCSFPG